MELQLLVRIGRRKSKEAFLYTEGVQLTAAHSGGRSSDLTQENKPNNENKNYFLELSTSSIITFNPSCHNISS